MRLRWVALACALSSLATVAVFEWRGVTPQPRPDRQLERACTLAEGHARVNEALLSPGHPRREVGLLLLQRDATWAPVCARDREAGAQLLLDVLTDLGKFNVPTDLGKLDAPNAKVLARRLVVLLEGR